MLLAQVSLVGGAVEARDHLSRFLGGHAATDFLCLLLEHVPVCGEFQSVFHISLYQRPFDADPISKVANLLGGGQPGADLRQYSRGNRKSQMLPVIYSSC